MPANAIAPIIPGFFPDPSICRVGDEYFIANSSFEYTPGVPIWKSRDLLSWEQVGNALTTPEQLDVRTTRSSLGICAPTLRHHDGQFWLITTNNDRITDGHTIVHAAHAEGPWSAPIFTAGTIGIDPDLVWDEDGNCYLTWTSFDPRWFGIVQARLDLESGRLLEDPRQLWSGTGLASPEGPHIYQRGEYWYLLVAEGGTQRGHSVSIARSRSIEGPFESCPANPILTHRSTHDPVQNTGHADLVEGPGGDWSMVYLGVRPRGGGDGYHVNGRETFIAGVTWRDDWPVVDERHYDIPSVSTALDDAFDSPLGVNWVSLRQPLTEFTEPVDGGGLVVRATPGGSVVLTRARDDHWGVRADIELTPGAVARLLVRLDDQHWCGIDLGDGIVARQQIGAQLITLGEASWSGTRGTLVARSVPVAQEHPALQTDPDEIVLSFVDDGSEIEVGRARGRYLSTEVAGGFTGRMLGVQAVSGALTIQRFVYEPHAAELEGSVR